MKPLLDETEDALERKLLEEARDYKASQAARAAAIAIVVTGKPVSFFKGLGLKVSLAVVAVAAVGGAWWMRKPAPRHVEPPAVVTTETTVTSQPTMTTIAPSPAIDPVAEPAIVPVQTAKAVPAQSAAKSTLSEEIAVIDRARSAVYSKDREGAIRALDEYDRRFPKGSLAPEAKTLRVRAGAL